MNQIRRLSGVIRIMPLLGGLFLIAMLSWIGTAYFIMHPEESSPEGFAADVIVPLAGTAARSAYAKTLLGRQAAAQLSSTLVDTHCLRMHGPNPVCATRVRNTIDEALVLRRVFEEEGFNRAIVVTSRYHVSRAAAVFRIIFSGSKTDVRFVAPPEGQLTQEQVIREAKVYAPSVAAAVVARIVPGLYEWSVRNRPACPDSLGPSQG
jgi:hypothetical protein